MSNTSIDISGVNISGEESVLNEGGINNGSFIQFECKLGAMLSTTLNKKVEYIYWVVLTQGTQLANIV